MKLFFSLMRWHAIKWPKLNKIFSTWNGVKFESEQAAIRAKTTGLVAGVPDIIWPVKNDRFSGLWLEMKIKPNRPTEKQLEFIELLNSEGYHAQVVWSAREAEEVVINYINNKL